MISYKIWHVQAEVIRHTNTANLFRPRGSRVIMIIVESGMSITVYEETGLTCTDIAAVYSAMLIVLIAASATNAVAMLAVLNLVRPSLPP